MWTAPSTSSQTHPYSWKNGSGRDPARAVISKKNNRMDRAPARAVYTDVIPDNYTLLRGKVYKFAVILGHVAAGANTELERVNVSLY